MGEFVRVLAASDLPPGKATEALVDGRPVALFNVGGVFHALSNRCVHRGGPLGQGVLDGATVVCPWHAWTYDVTTGISSVNPDLKVARYETKVEGGDVFVRVE
ncbi:MAG TPA: Rieske (2Fe-2S) protein [Vicinamibacteria bacterium]|nr:Rieske (2Fe-2S) protein [Vicinamibacteria bacterium]